MFVPEPTWRLQKFTRWDVWTVVFCFLSQQLWRCGWWVAPAGESSRYLSVNKYLLLLCVCASPTKETVLVLCGENTPHISMYCLPAAVISVWKDTHKILSFFLLNQLNKLLKMHRCTSEHLDIQVLVLFSFKCQDKIYLCEKRKLENHFINKSHQKQSESDKATMYVYTRSLGNFKVWYLSYSCSFTFFPLLFSWLLGRRPEYTDPKVVAQGEGREGLLCICDSIYFVKIKWTPGARHF